MEKGKCKGMEPFSIKSSSTVKQSKMLILQGSRLKVAASVIAYSSDLIIIHFLAAEVCY